MAIYVTINIWQDILATNQPWHAISAKQTGVQNKARKLLKQSILTVNYFGKQ